MLDSILFKPCFMRLEEYKKMKKDAGVPKDEVLKALDKELEDEETHLNKLPTHGVHMGMVEFQNMGKNHPVLVEFFEKADEVLSLKDKEKTRFIELTKRYFDGEATDDELKEMERDFFNPYFVKELGDSISKSSDEP